VLAASYVVAAGCNAAVAVAYHGWVHAVVAAGFLMAAAAFLVHAMGVQRTDGDRSHPRRRPDVIGADPGSPRPGGGNGVRAASSRPAPTGGVHVLWSSGAIDPSDVEDREERSNGPV
jgi:hypothetical protein